LEAIEAIEMIAAPKHKHHQTSQSTHAFDFADLVCDTLSKLLVQFVEITEQSRILDRYHRLVGKRFDQLNLPIREKSDFPTEQSDSTDRVSVPQHWHREKRPKTGDEPAFAICAVILSKKLWLSSVES
jgi:hypothetical protein